MLRALLIIAALLTSAPSVAQPVTAGVSNPISGKTLRIVTWGNRSAIAKTALTGTTLNFVSVCKYYIGSGPVQALRASLDNYYYALVGSPGAGGGGEINPGNAVVIDEASFNNGTVTAPITFSGARSKSLADGDVRILADTVYVTSLGYSSMPRDTALFVKLRGHVASNGQFIVGGRSSSEFTGMQGAVYDPAATLISSTDATGVYTVLSGTALSTITFAYCPQVAGYFNASTDPTTYSIIEDSHGQLTNTLIAPFGDGKAGLVRNAMVNSDGATNFFASIALGAPGVPYAGFTSNCTGSGTTAPCTKWTNYAAMTCFGIAEQGGNFSATANFDLAWASFYSSGVTKLLTVQIGPTSASSDLWATFANQSQPPTPANPNANKATDATYITSKLGVLYDYIYNWATWQDTDINHIVSNTTANYATADGLHEKPTTFNGLSGINTVDFRTNAIAAHPSC